MAWEPVSIGRRHEAQYWKERAEHRDQCIVRDFWQNQAPDLFCEAVWENLMGNQQACRQIVQAIRNEDHAELGRLVKAHVEPYLDYQLEIARESS